MMVTLSLLGLSSLGWLNEAIHDPQPVNVRAESGASSPDKGGHEYSTQVRLKSQRLPSQPKSAMACLPDCARASLSLGERVGALELKSQCASQWGDARAICHDCERDQSIPDSGTESRSFWSSWEVTSVPERTGWNRRFRMQVRGSKLSRERALVSLANF
jgi:hypothetical protein